MMVLDQLRNLVANIGTSRDKQSSSFYLGNVIADNQLANAYRGSWLARKVVDIPAFDAVREWRTWTGADDKDITKLVAAERELMVRKKVQRAMQLGRLWGGAALLIGDGAPDPSEPLDVERAGLGGIKYLTAISRIYVTPGPISRDITSEFYGDPEYYQIAWGGRAGRMYKIHPSRLVLFNGAGRIDDDVAYTGGSHIGWGDSVISVIYDALSSADATIANIASLVFEAKIDVIKMPDLTKNVTDPGYRQALEARFTLAGQLKGNNGMLLLDAEEEYQSKSFTYAGLPDVLDRFLQIASGAADIPMTRLLGQSPAGLNSTGESDLQNYYNRIGAMQDLELQENMRRLDDMLIRHALGTRPEEIEYDWAPLWKLSAKEIAEMGKITAETAKTLTGMVPDEPLSESTVAVLTETGAMPGLAGNVQRWIEENPDEPVEGEQPEMMVLQPQQQVPQEQEAPADPEV